MPTVKNQSGSRILAAGGSKLKVAVKRWLLLTTHFGFEWQMELNVLGMNAHPNLIELIGTCLKDQEMFFVYEYTENGSLDDYLFNKKSHYKEPLTWDIRISIALGAARGIAFLHTLDNPVIHRDIRTSHILLDRSYNPKITAFGLAIPGPSDGNSYVETTAVVGTYGFVAPEYVATGNLHIKSDVYSFGVVLLEMITGRHAMDRRLPEGQMNIVDWAKSQLGRRKKMLFFGQPNKKKLINTIIDVDMTSECSLEAAYEALQLAMKCTRSDPHTRPSMTQVVEALESIKAIK
ncbi:hypothetical protein Dimus_019578 [Dionaea muscipula]